MTGAASATDPDLLEYFAPLLRHLRNHRFQLSIVDELRVLTLHQELRRRGIRISDRIELVRVIAPIVCRSADEQERLSDILDSWKIVAERQAAGVARPTSNLQESRRAPADESPRPVPKVQAAIPAQAPWIPAPAVTSRSSAPRGRASNGSMPPNRRGFLPWVGGGAVLALLLIAYLLWVSLA